MPGIPFANRNKQINTGVVKAHDHCYAVHGDGQAGKSLFKLGLLQFTGGHTDIAHAIDGGSHAGRGVALLQLDLHIGIHVFVGFLELLHDRRNRGGTRNHNLAGNLTAIKSRSVFRHSDIAVGFDDCLTFRTHDESDEIFSGVGNLRLGSNVERTGHLVAAVFDILHRSLHTVNQQRLDRLIHGTEADVANSTVIASYTGHHDGGGIGNIAFVGGIIGLFTVLILLFNAEQLDKRAACAGTLLT